MSELYIILIICYGKQCLSLLRIPRFVAIFYYILFMLQYHFELLFIVKLKRFKVIYISN